MSDVLPENYNLPLYLLLQTFLNPECLGDRITYLFQYLSMCIVVTLMSVNTFTAIVDLSRFNNLCLKSPASTLVDLTFQSHALPSFSLNQLRNLSETAHSPSKHKDKHGFIISQCKHTEL